MSSPVIPAGGLVLVTGFTGYVGSAVVKALLDAGYKVRGSTRTVSKAQSLVDSFNSQYGQGSVEVVGVENMDAPGAFDEAVKDVAGVIHVATVMSLSEDPKEVITPAVKGTLSILRSAAGSPTVERFVLTSSITAAGWGAVAKTLNEDSWNESAVKAAWSLPPQAPGLKWCVYAASKTEGEKAAHKFVRDEKPGFVFNAVLPGICIGPGTDPSVGLSSGGWIDALLTGDDNAGSVPLPEVPSTWFVDTRDVALLHLAAITTAGAHDRIFAVEGAHSYKEGVDILRKLHPGRDIRERGTGKALANVDNSKSLTLLRGLGRPGYRTFEETLRDQTVVHVGLPVES